MLEPRYYYALGVLIFWIVIRLFLMYRRKVLIQRWKDREEALAREDQVDNSNLKE